jgi:hypothetical protein
MLRYQVSIAKNIDNRRLSNTDLQNELEDARIQVVDHG